MDEVTTTVAHALPEDGVKNALIGVAALVLATLMVCDAGSAPVAAIENASDAGETVSSGPLAIVNDTWIGCRAGFVPGASMKTVALCLPTVMLDTTCVFKAI